MDETVTFWLSNIGVFFQERVNPFPVFLRIRNASQSSLA